jgi:hypothetical protein
LGGAGARLGWDVGRGGGRGGGAAVAGVSAARGGARAGPARRSGGCGPAVTRTAAGRGIGHARDQSHAQSHTRPRDQTRVRQPRATAEAARPGPARGCCRAPGRDSAAGRPSPARRIQVRHSPATGQVLRAVNLKPARQEPRLRLGVIRGSTSGPAPTRDGWPRRVGLEKVSAATFESRPPTQSPSRAQDEAPGQVP